jgi:hypothetical protein
LFEHAKKTLKQNFIKINDFLKEYNLIIFGLFLAIFYIIDPTIRWIYPYAFLITGIAIVLFVIIFCPLMVLMILLMPLLWVAEKIEKRKEDKKHE